MFSGGKDQSGWKLLRAAAAGCFDSGSMVGQREVENVGEVKTPASCSEYLGSICGIEFTFHILYSIIRTMLRG